MPWIIGAIIVIMLMAMPERWNKRESTLKEGNELQKMTDDAKESLHRSNEINTIRELRKKYNLSLVDAKRVMDVAKE